MGMEYDALTIDTQTIETNGFYFDGGLLAQLKQFADGPIEVVVSQVVVAEIARHLREKTQSAKDALESAYKKAQLYGLKAPDDKAFAEAPDTRALTHKRLIQYIQDIGATIVKVDDLPMRDLVRTYLQGAPPFAGAGKKKNEFPDAIALLSLEQWARSQSKRILAVSGDSDWAAFAEKSEFIDVVAELSDALARLQEDADEAEVIVQRLLASIKSGADAKLADDFERLLGDAVSTATVEVDGSSAYRFEGEVEEIALTRYEIDETNGDFSPQIVQVGRAIIVASIAVHVEVAADATFWLSTYDSIDRDYVGIGSSGAHQEHEEDITVLVTFEGDFSAGTVELTKVELTDGLKSIDFGEIEPDYSEPDYDEFGGNEEVAEEEHDPPTEEETF